MAAVSIISPANFRDFDDNLCRSILTTFRGLLAFIVLELAWRMESFDQNHFSLLLLVTVGNSGNGRQLFKVCLVSIDVEDFFNYDGLENLGDLWFKLRLDLD